MPSLPTHAIVALALGQSRKRTFRIDWWFWFLAVFCSILPDFDVIGFSLGLPYGDFWGHRGLTHSILFALVVGSIAGIALGGRATQKFWNGVLLFVITASHGVLDAMTNGGLGVAFFSPFDTTRYFFSWRPIQVSPIGAGFLSARGLDVLMSEALIVWVPALALGLSLYGIRRLRERNRPGERNS
jgi:inner membrane protein